MISSSVPVSRHTQRASRSLPRWVLLASLGLLIWDGGCVQVDLRTRKMAQDALAAANMRRLVEHEKVYRARNGRYARALRDLGVAPDMGLALSTEGACGRGYCYQLHSDGSTYQLRAWRDGRDSGYRSFYADQNGVVRYTAQARIANDQDDPVR